MTPYEKVYGRFLPKTEDYSFIDQSKFETDEDLYLHLYEFLVGSIVKFKQCESDLTEYRPEKNEDNKDEYYRLIGFNGDLTTEEIEILSNLMIVEYLTPKIISTQNMRQRLSDKEYQMYSQSQHLSQMVRTQQYYSSVSNQMITSYTYSNGLDDLL